MDYMDHIQEKTEILLEKQIAEFRDKNCLKGTSSLYCIECGSSIPEARRRLLAGVKLCFDCQVVAERRQKLIIPAGPRRIR